MKKGVVKGDVNCAECCGWEMYVIGVVLCVKNGEEKWGKGGVLGHGGKGWGVGFTSSGWLLLGVERV